MENTTDNHIVLMVFLAIGLLVISAVVPQVSTYSFIVAVMVIIFIIYLKVATAFPDFVFKDYDVMLGDKIYYENVKTFDGSIKGIFLTGENIFPYKKIADCSGVGAYSLDTFPEDFKDSVDLKGNKIKIPNFDSAKMKSKKIFIFWYNVYSIHFIIKIFQTIIPKIPIFSDIMGSIPLVKTYCFPTARGIIAPEDIVKFKSNIVEIIGLSLMPLTVKECFNTFSIVEYSGKFNEMRDFERFIFDKTLSSYGSQEMLNTAINTANAGAKLNPKVKVENEQSIIKTR